jgi:hypothetical protein
LTESRTRNTLLVVVVFGLCSFSYLLGLWRRSGSGRGDSLQIWVNEQTKCVQLTNLNFETHHSAPDLPNGTSSSEVKAFEPCDEQYTDCKEQKRAMTFPRDNMIYRERRCPPDKEKLHCLVLAPKGYVTPFHGQRAVILFLMPMYPTRALQLKRPSRTGCTMRAMCSGFLVVEHSFLRVQINI